MNSRTVTNFVIEPKNQLEKLGSPPACVKFTKKAGVMAKTNSGGVTSVVGEGVNLRFSS